MQDKISFVKHLNKKKQIYCFFLFTSFSVFGQTYSIMGTLKNNDSLPVENANIIIKNLEDKIVAFGTSNTKGVFIIKTNSGNYKLKITNLGYKNYEQTITIKSIELNLGTVILTESNTELDEVILKAEKNGITQNGDTTLYNIDKFLNGTEENLKDVINRLPGLGINDTGKITANGKVIDKLLIDGEDLFKRQHQLATENLSSKMIKDVELIRNYKGFESIQENDNTGITALNVNIKDEFKNKFTGNIDASAGIINKYKLNLPIFNFSKRIKFSTITNLNNTGESPIGLDDYSDLINPDEKSSTGSSQVLFTNLNDVPRFISAGNNVKSRATNFITISSIFNVNKKTKIDFYSIFNNTNQEEFSFRNTILNPSTDAIQINETNFINEKNYFFTSQLKSTYKFNDKTVLSFNNRLNLDQTNQDHSIENNFNNTLRLIDEQYAPKKTTFNSSLNYKKKVTSNVWASNLFFNYNKNENQITINSNEAFLELAFENSTFLTNQFFSKESKETGFDFSYTLNRKKTSINFFSNSNFINTTLESEVSNRIDFENYLNLNRFTNTIGTNITFKINSILNYTLGFSFNDIQSEFNATSRSNNYLAINSSLKAQFTSNKIGQISYNYSNSITTIDNLIDKPIIKNYRNLIANENVEFNTLLPYHQFNFSQFIFNYKSKFSFIFNSSLNIKSKSINNNFFNSPNVSIARSVIIDNDKIFDSFVFIDKEFKNLPLSFSGSLSYGASENDYFLNSNLNQFKNENISHFLKIKSTFKKSLVHFDIGSIYSKDVFYNNDNKSNLSVVKPYLNLNGNFSKELFWNLNSIFASYKSANNQRELFLLSPKLRFQKQNSNWEFHLIGDNILNLKNQTIIENIASASIFEQRLTSILNGYILLGSKLKF